MRYLLTLLAGAAVGFLLAWAFHVDDVRPIVEAPTLRAPTPHLVEQTEERLQPHAPVTLSTPAAERRAVPAHDEHDLAEAIAEAEATRAQYDALLADDGRAAMQLRMEEAEGEVNALRGRIAWLERELALATLDPATPLGHFATLPELTDADPKTLRAAQSWLEQFPVMLAPHEAEWLRDRIVARDWRDWPGSGSEETLITYLGPDRLKAELQPGRVAELVAYYSDEPWVFGE